jgi:hypothetical protein
MKQDIRFVNLPKSTFVFDFIRNKVRRYSRATPSHQNKIEVVLKRENDAERSNGQEEYICEIIYLHRKKRSVIEKRSSNLYRAISSCFSALKNLPTTKKNSKPFTRKERRLRLMAKKKANPILVA